MSIIEQKIKKNASLFNSREPSDAHLENFEAKLKALHPEKERKIKFNYRNALKLAASIAILVSLSFVLFKYGNFGKQLQAADLGPEYVELKDYYSSVNQQKLAEIDALIADDEDAKY